MNRFLHIFDSVLIGSAMCLGSIVTGYIVADLICRIIGW
jgi:hypothetical protein